MTAKVIDVHGEPIAVASASFLLSSNALTVEGGYLLNEQTALTTDADGLFNIDLVREIKGYIQIVLTNGNTFVQPLTVPDTATHTITVST